MRSTNTGATGEHRIFGTIAHLVRGSMRPANATSCADCLSSPLGRGTVRAAMEATDGPDLLDYLYRLGGRVRTVCAAIYLILNKSNPTGTITAAARLLVDRHSWSAWRHVDPVPGIALHVHFMSSKAPPPQSCAAAEHPRAGSPITAMMVRANPNVVVHYAACPPGITHCIPNNDEPARKSI